MRPSQETGPILTVVGLTVSSLISLILLGCSSISPNSNKEYTLPLPKMLGGNTNSPFAKYDAEVVRAIQARWYELLSESERRLKPDIYGKVVVQFHLLTDGRVKALKVVDSDVDEIRTMFCLKAISDLSPFHRWPDEMVRVADRNLREVRFTFYYE